MKNDQENKVMETEVDLEQIDNNVTGGSFLEDIRGKLDNVFNKLKPDLEKGAETIDKALEGVF